MKKFWPYIAGGVAILLLIFFMPGTRKEKKHFDDNVTLNIRDKIPYGCYATYELLPKLFPQSAVTTNRESPENWKELSLDSSGQLLLIVTKYFDPTARDLDYITGLAQRGNYVLISSVDMSWSARQFFKVKEQFMDADKDDRAMDGQPLINVSNTFGVRMDTGITGGIQWFHYPGARFGNELKEWDKSITYPLGYTNEGLVNLAGYHSKKGIILLHTTPLTFSNFFVLYQDNYKYLQQLVSVLPAVPKHIVWDEYYLHSRAAEKEQRGLLSVLFDYENFRWAFWLVLAVLGLYLLTETKRRQRMIPIISKPVNESLEFVKVIGKLYFQKGDHSNLALKMTQFFLEHVRNKYKLDTQYINSSFAVILAAKSGITTDMAGKLVDYITEAQLGSITAEDLTAYYVLLDKFYKTT